jgi:hypothetical protein
VLELGRKRAKLAGHARGKGSGGSNIKGEKGETMAGMAVAGIVLGVFLTLGVQSAARRIRARVRKLLKPQVKGQIRNGRRVK